MAGIYGDNEGKVIALTVPGGMPALVSIGGLTDTTSQILVLSMGFGQGANVQFMHTLKNAIYIYAFGERLGSVKVQGLLVFRSCDGGSAGLPKLLEYYKANTVSLNGEPVSISLSTEVLKGFLTGISLGGFDPRMGTAQFTLQFASLPVE